jgi:hypothetical protein
MPIRNLLLEERLPMRLRADERPQESRQVANVSDQQVAIGEGVLIVATVRNPLKSAFEATE